MYNQAHVYCVYLYMQSLSFSSHLGLPSELGALNGPTGISYRFPKQNPQLLWFTLPVSSYTETSLTSCLNGIFGGAK